MGIVYDLWNDFIHGDLVDRTMAAIMCLQRLAVLTLVLGGMFWALDQRTGLGVVQNRLNDKRKCRECC